MVAQKSYLLFLKKCDGFSGFPQTILVIFTISHTSQLEFCTRIGRDCLWKFLVQKLVSFMYDFCSLIAEWRRSIVGTCLIIVLLFPTSLYALLNISRFLHFQRYRKYGLPVHLLDFRFKCCSCVFHTCFNPHNSLLSTLKFDCRRYANIYTHINGHYFSDQSASGAEPRRLGHAWQAVVSGHSDSDVGNCVFCSPADSRRRST